MRESPLIKSRFASMMIGLIGLTLQHAPDFISFGPTERRTSHLFGLLLFCLFFYAFATRSERATDQSGFANSLVSAITALAATGFLVANVVMHPHQPIRGIFELAGWSSFVVCLSMQKSKWQAFAFSGVLLLALAQVRWRSFLAFASINPLALVFVFAGWLLITILVFYILGRRKASPPTR